MLKAMVWSGIKINMRVYGVPVQFLLVFVMSAIVVVYLASAVATARIEARTEGNVPVSVDSYKWEQAAIWACPLH